MSKNKRYISVTSVQYERLYEQAQQEGISVSFLVERDAARVLGHPDPKPRKSGRKPQSWL